MATYRKSKKQTRNFKTFLEELKNGKMGSVVMMYGEEEYLIRWAVNNVKKAFVKPGMEVVDYQVLDEGSAGAEDIVKSCETFSLMSEKRVVWVPDFLPLSQSKPVKGYSESDLEILNRYCADPNPSTVLVLSAENINARSGLVKTIKKKGSYYEFGPLNERELASFANKRFRAAGFQIGRREMDFLIHETGYFNRESEYRLHNFENDLFKIVAHAEGGYITEEDIAVTVAGDRDKFIFDLIDGISGNNKTKAFEILHNRLTADSSEALAIVGSIVSQVELMLEVKEFSESPDGTMTIPEMKKYTKINEYRLKKAYGYAKRYSQRKLREMLSRIYETNVSIVSGLLDPRTALELFIASI